MAENSNLIDNTNTRLDTAEGLATGGSSNNRGRGGNNNNNSNGFNKRRPNNKPRNSNAGRPQNYNNEFSHFDDQNDLMNNNTNNIQTNNFRVIILIFKKIFCFNFLLYFYRGQAIKMLNQVRD